jgi:hypothetical protein
MLLSRHTKRREFITLLGGGLLAGGDLLANAAFAQSIGRWTIGTPMPSARTEVAVAEVGGKIYVVGGFGGERELEIYGSAADRWSRGASIPRALHHAAAVGLKDMREQFEMLKHHADAGAQLRQVGLAVADGNAGDRDGAFLERLEPIDAFDQRRLARARWTAHAHDFALGDLRRAMLQHLKVGVPLADFAERDHGDVLSG